MDGDGESREAKSAPEILASLRARLKEQIKSEMVSGPGASYEQGGEQVSIQRLHVLLEASRAFHRQVGALNPRPSGPINGLIQLFKKALGRLLGWYTRPIVQYQARTIQLLNEVAEMLERDQSRLESLEAKLGLLANELANMRQDTLAKLEGVSQELENREKAGH